MSIHNTLGTDLSPINKKLNQVRDLIFQNIHSNHLIYNTCWEDPRCDRTLLQFDEKSKIVMITSAGCNALDYLLDNPQAIHSIDMNPRQNALLELKVRGIQHLDFSDFWQFFGEGFHPRAVAVYARQLRAHLSYPAQEFWDKNIIFFQKKSFYFYGTSGTFAWLFNKYFDARPKLRALINELLEAPDLATQQAVYQKIEPKVVTPFAKWLMGRHVTLTLLGVPRAQRQLIIDEYPGGVAAYVADSLRQVFTEIPVHDNYFWRLYLTGRYKPECAPSYLQRPHFELLKLRLNQLHWHTTTISNFLQNHPDQYTHYILLDHQDWLAAHDVPALEEEWRLILENSQPGTKILMRSAALRVDFFPDFVKEALRFEEDLTSELHQVDRVGTYGSVYLGTVL